MSTSSRTAAPSRGGRSSSKTFEVKGLKLKLPAKLPFAAMQFLHANAGAGEVVGLLELLLGPEQLQKVWDLGLDLQEGTQLVKDLTDLFEISPGESAASPSS